MISVVTRGLGSAAVALLSCVGIAYGQEDPSVRPFRSVQQIFTQSCAFPTCHSAVARQGGLILEHEDLSYRALVDQPSTHPDAKAAGLLRVASGDPANSFLIRKLKALGPGDSMPQGGGMLPDDVIAVIEDWVRRGAHETVEECPALPPDTEGGQGQHGQSVPTICDDTPIPGDFEWEPEPPLDPPAPGDGIQLYIPPKPVDPGTEWEACYALRLKDIPNADKLATPIISHQEYRMHTGSHHLLLYMYFGNNPDQFAEGWYPCVAGNCISDSDCPEDSGGLQIPIGGTQVAGTAYQVNYPEGVGLPFLGSTDNVVFIANSHYTNPFQPPQPIYGEAWLNLRVHKPGEFKVVLNGIFAINSNDLIVEPYQTKTINRVWKPRNFIGGGAVDAAIFQLFGHMHKRGRVFDINLVDAPCAGDCDANNQCEVNELVTGVNIALGRTETDECANFDTDFDEKVGVNELVAGVNVALRGCQREPEIEIYRTTAWDAAPIQTYDFPYLEVDRNEGLRWSCTHQNGRMLEDGVTEDPTYPAKKCHDGCRVCGWDAETRTCKFTRDRSNRVYQEGEPMPLAFGLLADDDMCNMFGYFIGQDQVPLLP
jgi:hypothetical protein